MYLKSLTLKGFKSFAQPTTFAFEPGVTCVIGPNGSGKSNVVDALAWVMGEQGAKTLRGGKMEDVIFAGTETRGPLGRAEVHLTIDNSDGALPIEYTEVTISRTLFRNGGSEYAINGQSCRLLDVQELLSDSGLGREMHVIVGQGQLDAVLRATPEERRGFIEEAAGILKHRRRKEKTLRKLDAMQTNLTRLSDLAGEVRRQLKPLGHQAEIAREAQSIAAIVRDARARLLADDVVGLRRTLDGHVRTEAERHTEQIVLQEQLEQKLLRRTRLEQAQVSDRADAARATAFALEQAQDRLRSLYTLATQRLALLGSQAEAAADGPRVSLQMVQDAADEAERLRTLVAEAEAAWRTAQEATRQARSRLDSVDEEIAAQSALVSKHDLEISTLNGQAEAAAQRLAAVRGEVLRQQNALDAATERREKARAEFAAREADAAIADAGEDALDELYEIAQADVFEAEGEIERLREELHALERERDALAARTSALSLALGQKDGSAALVAARPTGVRGLAAEHIRVRPGYEAAVAAALGTLADAVLADTRDAAFEAVALAAADDFGRVEVIVADAPAVIVDLSGVEGVRPAREVVDAPSGVLGILAFTAIADDLDSARAASDAYRKRKLAGPVTLITRAGEVLTEHLLRGGSGAKQSRIELLADRDAAEERLAEVASLSDRARFALAEQRGVLQVAKEQSQTALAALRESDAKLAAQAEQLNRVKVQLEAAQAEFDRLSRALEQAAERVAEAESAAERAAFELAAARSRPRPILDVSARDTLSSELEAARETEVESRLAVETAKERVRAEQARGEALARQLEAERAAADEAARRAVIRRRQLDAAQSVVDALPAVLASADRSVSQARVELASAEAERASQNEELQTVRREEGLLRERLHAITESVHGLELQIYEKKLHLSSLLERAGSELGLVEEVLVAEYGPEVPVPVDRGRDDEPLAAGEELPTVPFAREQQQKRLAAAERKLGQLGRVNPLALEEFAALEQRHKFLSEQLVDLTSTRKDLLTIIEEIDEKMQTIFESAFTDTEEAFRRVFPILFPGGTGSIVLTAPDDLLTTGIEVSVKPAGKKVERLSLLSGGERSLAAVALLVAIFKARPSPFYIMDEVEAALDDANLGRLLTIFEDLRENSQLIVITHQKRTMEVADALYGVSMRQDGVSAVVGQRVAQERAS
ncbi:chromosome segregation protein SMC [Leifsonia xyli subsp. xyli]|uniref:Chromosome partition protein Smc n=2 Tax=Leifsonia xyli subsp. xyli TaxID=59736 RepID=Q6AE90_LEIXX|nr:chromosome segregation protein SMC [Leifsonia xyli]AAT89306.1 chromosome segregation protein [Leifsonia xyli subsp. xyli str. CTCB07]ODA89638.1 chromosome segregation protein SMC [Leifsonia xyli subsp. xyli]